MQEVLHLIVEDSELIVTLPRVMIHIFCCVWIVSMVLSVCEGK